MADTTNPVILYSPLEDWVFTASGGSDTGFDVTNLNTYFADQSWLSGSTSNGQTLAIDTGVTTFKADSLLLENFINMTPMDVDLEADDNSGFSSPELILDDLMGKSQGDPRPYIRFFDLKTYRYWRLKFVNTASAKPPLGQIFLGKVLAFDSTQRWGYPAPGARFDTDVVTELDGRTRTSQAYGGRIALEFEFPLQSDTFATDFNTFQQTVRGRLNPFYYRVDGGQNSDLYYVHLTDDVSPIQVPINNQNTIRRLRMREQLATIS